MRERGTEGVEWRSNRCSLRCLQSVVAPKACSRCSLLVVRVRVVQATSVAVVGVQSRIADAYTKGTQTEEPWGTAGPGMP